MRPAIRALLVASLAGIIASAPAFAGVSLEDGTRLETLLADRDPCCVIDARADAHRKLNPIDAALPYKEGLRINPSGAVVVVGDTDEHALQVAQRLARESAAREVYAVRGGYSAWRKVLTAQAGRGGPASFVIPSDTCQTGPVLQHLRSGE